MNCDFKSSRFFPRSGLDDFLIIECWSPVFCIISIFFVCAERMFPEPGVAHREGVRLRHPLPPHTRAFLHAGQVEMFGRDQACHQLLVASPIVSYSGNSCKGHRRCGRCTFHLQPRDKGAHHGSTVVEGSPLMALSGNASRLEESFCEHLNIETALDDLRS